MAKKVSAGGDLIITQLFFNNQDFFFFEKRMREKGITVPILPGIMPITNYNQIVRFTQNCGAKMSESLLKDLEKLQDDPEGIQKYGINYALKQCEELIAHGVPGIHLYTLNKSHSAQTIITTLRKKIKKS